MNENPLVTFSAVATLAFGFTVSPPSAAGGPLDERSSAATSGSVLPRQAPDDAFDCLIEPTSLIELGSSTQGVVARLLVERGESVTRGQALVELESGVEAALLEQAEARAEMQSEVDAREAEFAFAKLEFSRFDEMHTRALVPEQRRDEVSAQRRIAAAALVQAIENRRLLQLDVKRMRRELERRTLRSPVDGIVVEHLVSIGESVRDDAVTRIAQLDPLKVEAVLPGRLFGTLEQGRGARVYPEFDNGAPLVTTVDVVDPMLDARSGTFGVGLTLANPDLAIAGGQRCRIVFDDAPAIAAAVGADGETTRAGIAAGDAVDVTSPSDARAGP